MIKSKRMWLALVSLPILGFLAFGNLWPIYGLLRGESFYNGLPTSYWEWELEHWEFFEGRGGAQDDDSHWCRLDRISQRTPNTPIPFAPPSLSLLSGDPATEGVLKELRLSSSNYVQSLAKVGLEEIKWKRPAK